MSSNTCNYVDYRSIRAFIPAVLLNSSQCHCDSTFSFRLLIYVTLITILILTNYGWRPFNGRPELRMDVWLQAKVRGRWLGPQPIGCMPALSVTQKRRCSCGMPLVALYKCYMPLPLTFELVIMVYRCLSGRAPQYLAVHCVPLSIQRHLRSAERNLLHVPRHQLNMYGSRAFAIAIMEQSSTCPQSERHDAAFRRLQITENRKVPSRCLKIEYDGADAT